MAVAEAIAGLLSLYTAAGVVFAVFFLVAGIQRVDSQARGTRFGFRLIVFPGVAALWPLFLRRWLQGAPEPPIERNPHREAVLPKEVS